MLLRSLLRFFVPRLGDAERDAGGEADCRAEILRRLFCQDLSAELFGVLTVVAVKRGSDPQRRAYAGHRNMVTA